MFCILQRDDKRSTRDRDESRRKDRHRDEMNGEEKHRRRKDDDGQYSILTQQCFIIIFNHFTPYRLL